MTIEQAVALIEQLGIPTAIIVALAWFVSHDLWPFVTEKMWPYLTDRIEKGDREKEKITAERIDDRRAFLEALEKRDKALSLSMETLATNQENRDKQLAATLEVRDTRLVGALNAIAESLAKVQFEQPTPRRKKT